MDLPPNVASTFVNVTTSATPSAVTTGVVLAAPGAGVRYRLFAWSYTHATTSQAPGNWRCALQTPGGSPVLYYSGAGFTGSPLLLILYGLSYGPNLALNYGIADSVASIAGVIVVHYTTESA